MKLNWGIKIALLYCGFVVLIMTLVFKSMHQHFDLVSKDYYKDELAYQNVIDAGKNQADLSAPVNIHATASEVVFEFPEEFKNREMEGKIQFYSPVNAAWDRDFDLSSKSTTINIGRNKLNNINYKIKISWRSGDKKYYQESDLNLHS
jgi:nitrogen fixation protein FixH